MADYRFDTLGLVAPEAHAGLHEVVEDRQGASRAGIAVVSESAEPGDTALALTDGALSALGADELLIDWEPCELAGASAVRTLVLEQLGGLASVVLEQWRLVAAGEAWEITATADLAAWAHLASGLRDVVATLEVEP